MDPLITSALVSAGANTLGNIFNVFGQNQANNANMELAKYQYEKNLEMWNRQNEYNLPVNQMARLRQAGINPVMAFSGGQVSGNVANNAPQYDRPQLQPYQVDSSGLAQIGSSYIMARQAQQQIELQKSQVQVNQAKVITENCVQLLKTVQAVSADQQVKYFDEVKPLLIDTIKANKDMIDKRIANVEADTEYTQGRAALIPLQATEIIHSVAKMDSETRLNAVRAVQLNVLTNFERIKMEFFKDTTEDQKQMLKKQVEGIQKLNDIRDLEKWIKDFNNDKAPMRYKIEMLMAVISALSQVTGAGANVGKIMQYF